MEILILTLKFNNLLTTMRVKNFFFSVGLVFVTGCMGFQLSAQTKMPPGWQSSYVKITPEGELNYIPDAEGNIIPDFSRVGYHHGDKGLPHFTASVYVTPVDGDNWANIQAAIDKVAALPLDSEGHRGVVRLARGVYPLSKTIVINTDGVVLQGEGSNVDETRLVAITRERYPLIRIAGQGNREEIPGTRVHLTDAFVPVGVHSFHVSDASGFKPGDRVILYRPGTQEWIHDIKMDQIVERQGTRQWTAREYNLAFEREVTAVDGDCVYIDNPVVMQMSDKYGGGELYKYTFDGRISEVGVRDLCLDSEFDDYEDTKHGWIGVQLDKAENCWVDNVTGFHLGYACVSCERNAKNITVRNCRCLSPKSVITGGLRYAFNNIGQQNLFINCQSREGRHDYVTGSQVCGPNVFHNCTATQSYADIGPHHRWAVGTLYDNIVTDGEINVQDRGKMGSGHGWAGVTQVLWNCHAGRVAVQSPWASGKNYSIGTKGKRYAGVFTDRPDGEWEGENETNVFPRSLYLAQLMARKKADLKHFIK